MAKSKIKNVYKKGSVRNGDVIIYVSPGAAVLVLLAGALVYAGFVGVLMAMDWIDAKIRQVAGIFASIANTVTDPKVSGYFAAIAVLLFVALSAGGYYWNRFNITDRLNKLKYWYHGEYNEDDIDW